MVRIKHRYLLLNILYPNDMSSRPASSTPDFLKFHAPTPKHINPQSFSAHLRNRIVASFGDQGLGLCLSSLKVIYFSNATSTAILRVPRTHHQIVWAALTYMTELPASREGGSTGKKCVVRIVRVSGTIRKAEEELLRRSRQQIVQARLAGLEGQDAILKRLVGTEDSIRTPDNDRNPVSDDEDLGSVSDSE